MQSRDRSKGAEELISLGIINSLPGYELTNIYPIKAEIAEVKVIKVEEDLLSTYPSIEALLISYTIASNKKTLITKNILIN